MKRFITFILICIVTAGVLSAVGVSETKQLETQAARETTDNAITAIPVPKITNFVERKTLAQWAQRWDKPSVVTYLYLFSYGQCIGYYVCIGKPAATTNYLVPEWKDHYAGNGAVESEQTMDLDGTYGANNPGIRFFTASGTAVEWAGQGASYLYSDAPIPLNVPKLGD